MGSITVTETGEKKKIKLWVKIVCIVADICLAYAHVDKPLRDMVGYVRDKLRVGAYHRCHQSKRRGQKEHYLHYHAENGARLRRRRGRGGGAY